MMTIEIDKNVALPGGYKRGSRSPLRRALRNIFPDMRPGDSIAANQAELELLAETGTRGSVTGHKIAIRIQMCWLEWSKANNRGSWKMTVARDGNGTFRCFIVAEHDADANQRKLDV